MGSYLFESYRISGILSLGLMVLLGMVRLSNGYSPSKWNIAHATFYGDDTASTTMGGACGYGNLFNNGYATNTAAVSSVLFRNGYGCGSCYQLMCVHSKWCNSRRGGYYGNPITITATNLCPPNWGQPTNPGGWCNPPRTHFDLSMPAFKKLAFWRAGIVPVAYRRVPCWKKGGIRIRLQGNNYWLLAYMMNVGGAGDIAQVWVKGSKTGWIRMSHNWRASYQAFAELGGQTLSFKLQSYSTLQVIVAYNVVPPYWSIGMTYQARVNFQ